MISQIAVRLRWLRRKASRTHWAARLLGIRPPAGEADTPGLIMLQIDGLSRTQLDAAIEQGNMPFVAKLLRQGHFTLENFYSGLPSTTPAVQAEIFFGARSAVPSFEFLHRKSGKVVRMYEAGAAGSIEDDLGTGCDDPLLTGAHAYSNIYRAGAVKSRYCSADLAPEAILRRLHPFKWLVLSLVYLPKILRMAALALLEFALAIFDVFRGLYQREDFDKEIGFVPARIVVCIVLRELIRFRVLLDIEAGVPMIHANFLGYDEQAHRRGPDSAFAHWTLKGIDRAIRDIYRAGGHSNYRDYELIIYSDHGQEHSTPFERAEGRPIDAVVAEVFSNGPAAGHPVWMKKLPELVGNTIDHFRHFFGMKGGAANGGSPDPHTHVIVTALGPIGHIYLPERMENPHLDTYSADLVKAGVPLVMRTDGPSKARAFNSHGEWSLPADASAVLGGGHPFLDEAAADLVELCHNTNAGDLVISGWSPRRPPVTFAMENGAHGGPGIEETGAFLLVPDRIRRWHIAHLANTGNRVRGEELRKITLHFLGRDGMRTERVLRHPAPDRDIPLRVMTYNIHSCSGMDGKVRPERVARVINHFDPDVVAVQEVDCHRPRSGGHDQAQLIADHLQMTHVFQALLEEKKERYGIAIFARYPFTVVRAGFLTEAFPRLLREARGAIWIKLDIEGRPALHVINTHFGLGREERHAQVAELLGDNWLGSIPDHEPVILCGDFNSGPRSKVVERLKRRLRDVQQHAPAGHKPRATFTSMKPVLRIDHVFVSRHFKVEHIDLPRTPTAVMASDHLPLCVELNLHLNGKS